MSDYYGDTKRKILKQNIAALRARLATTANKDQVRRQIKACQDRLAALD